MKIIIRKWWKIVKSCRESLRAPSNVAKHTVKNEMVLNSKRTKIVTFLGNFQTICLCNLKIVLRFCWCSFQTKKPIIVFLIIFCLIKTDLSDNTILVFYRKLLIFKNSPKLTIFGIFNYVFFVQSSRFTRNVECDFFFDFQTPYSILQIDKFSHGSSRAHSPPFLHWTVL